MRAHGRKKPGRPPISVDIRAQASIVRAEMTNRSQPWVAMLNIVLLFTQSCPAAGLQAFGQPVANEITGGNSGNTPATGQATENEQEATKPESTLPLEEPVDPEKYVCGSGDLFQLNFWGRQNSSVSFLIDPSGRAFVPRVGYVQVAGLLLKDAVAALQKAVSRYYPRLSFDFSLVKPRTFLVHVVGAVAKPGIYSAHATDRLTKVLTAAGGRSTPDAKGDGSSSSGSGSLRRIEISRRDGEKLPADLLLYQLHGDTKNNPYLNDGDIITVPFESLVASITGAVQRPGRYELVSTKDLSELVGAAGGLRATATKQLPILLSRRDQGNDRLAQARLAFPPSGELPPLALRNEDSIHLPVASELQRSVMLVGAIPGASQADEATGIKQMAYEQGDTVRTLIERAGGVGSGADYKGSYIVRMQGTEKVVIPLDLEALLVYRDMKADREVRIGDVINVPYQRHSIMVEGAVMRPGVYQFNPRFRVLDYIALAGGPSKMAQDTEEYRIVTPKGKSALISGKTEVQPGDTLMVPERHFSRAEVTQIVIAVAGLAITSAALILTAYSVTK
jgi:polysaccharide biosynthesis/export protein